MDATSQTPATRQRILDAAVIEFAENGFKNTTTRAICARAEVNNAAVNYHFRDKQHLYHCTLEMIIRQHIERTEKQPIQEGGTPEEELRHLIYIQLNQLFRCESCNYLVQIISHELLDPTPGLDVIIQGVATTKAPLRKCVQSLLGPNAPEEAVDFCVRCIMGQCFHLYQGRAFIARIEPETKFDEASIARHADQISRFSLGGIAACREFSAKQNS